ncbi:MAG: LL-diaminopimelate aminotransferase [Succinivibrio sp.]|nr:LL-diaminopimelate aminotransferase [Succinivibrio sp.]
MLRVNENYLKLRGSYLFSEIAKRVAAFKDSHPEARLVRLGIGDVTRPLTKSIISSLHHSVDEMAQEETFRGYAPDLGYAFLRETIAQEVYAKRRCEIAADEIFVSDGAKSDLGNLAEIFAESCRVAITDPVYPVYVDSNVMAGRAGSFNESTSQWDRLTYLPTTAENSFVPALPDTELDLIYICSPNNPTGTALRLAELQQIVDYAIAHHSVILFDAAYEAYISESDIPHSIYECQGARQCAIEVRSFSKNAGFTGLRLGYTVIPKELKDAEGHSIHAIWARRHGTKYNGAPYLVQRAGQAVYSPEGQQEVQELVSYYMHNAKLIREGLSHCGYTVYGGVNAPYIWLKVPEGLSSWAFFDRLLHEAQVVGTPGLGFGPSGEGYLRLTAFSTPENTEEALKRIAAMG